jgi:rfaE bifunctional protein kinase chain/domain
MQPTPQAASLQTLVAHFAAQRILVIGDLMLDEFIWGRVSRISPEAPVPVVEVTGESYYPGGAANVARNVREFTPAVSVMGVSGGDTAGRRLLGLLGASGIDTSAVQRDPGVPTTLKTRIVARHQQVVRVDRERKGPLPAAQTERAMRLLDGAIGDADAIVVADYGKGFLTQPLADYICHTARTQAKILAVDPHPHTSLFGPHRPGPRRCPAARSGPSSDGGLGNRQPADHPGGAGHAAAGPGRAAVPYPHAR